MGKTLEQHISEHVPENSDVLDIGCGIKTHSNYSKNTITLDAWEKLSPDILMDVTKEQLPFGPNSFDIITMIDFIEHIEKEEGEELLEKCKSLVRDKIIVFTPLFFTTNAENVEDPKCWAYGNPYDYHKSLWTLEDFSEWTTINIFKFRLGKVWLGYWKK